MRQIRIGKIKITPSGPLCFVADIAANHDGDLNRAFKLIELAKASGAHAAKFQNFQADKIVSKHGFESLSRKISHQASWKKSVYETYKDASIPLDWTKKLKNKCDEVGLEYFTSPYDFDSIDTVDPFVDVYKIGSGDITWLEIIKYMAKKGKPVMLASGASTIEDVKRAMNVLIKRTKKIVLMQCNTNYTGSIDNFKYINLNVLKLYKKLYPNVILGLSDHTPGHSTVLGAVALGAKVIEKHFTDDNSRIGPDHGFAMNPHTWKEMVDRTRELELSLGDGIKRIEKNEKKSIVVQRRSLRSVKNMKVGEIISIEDFESLRPIPKNGLPPYEINKLINKKLIRPLKKGEHITWRHIR